MTRSVPPRTRVVAKVVGKILLLAVIGVIALVGAAIWIVAKIVKGRWVPPVVATGRPAWPDRP